MLKYLLSKLLIRIKINTTIIYFQMNVCAIQMLYFDRIEVSGRIDVNKTSAPKECDICHYWHFLSYSF